MRTIMIACVVAAGCTPRWTAQVTQPPLVLAANVEARTSLPLEIVLRDMEMGTYRVRNSAYYVVVSRDRLLERVWGYDRSVETRSVDVHVGRLRSKLGDASRQIETVIGLGYRFVD